MVETLPHHERHFTPQEQDRFYETSVTWAEDLIGRHDPKRRLLGILPNDIQEYPFQSLNNTFIKAYEPSWQETMEHGGLAGLQAEKLRQMQDEAASLLGRDQLNQFVDDMLDSRTTDGRPESAIRTILGNLSIADRNVVTLAYHPNLMLLPGYSLATMLAFSRSEYLQGKFNLFDAAKQNIFFMSAAISVLSFKGKPAVERMTGYANLVKVFPPTDSTVNYKYDRAITHPFNRQANDAFMGYLADLKAQGLSAHLTIDPTNSTFVPETKGGKLISLRRKPIFRPTRGMVMDNFKLARTMTMIITEQSAAWHIGGLEPLRVSQSGTEEQISARKEKRFNDIIEELDARTAALAGLDEMSVGRSARKVGKTALKASNGLTA